MDPGVEVVDLGRESVEVVPTSVEVQSNEAESSLMDRSILTHVNAAHEPHVGVEQKGTPTAAPATLAMDPMKARRDSACRW